MVNCDANPANPMNYHYINILSDGTAERKAHKDALVALAQQLRAMPNSNRHLYQHIVPIIQEEELKGTEELVRPSEPLSWKSDQAGWNNLSGYWKGLFKEACRDLRTQQMFNPQSPPEGGLHNQLPCHPLLPAPYNPQGQRSAIRPPTQQGHLQPNSEDQGAGHVHRSFVSPGAKGGGHTPEVSNQLLVPTSSFQNPSFYQGQERAVQRSERRLKPYPTGLYQEAYLGTPGNGLPLTPRAHGFVQPGVSMVNGPFNRGIFNLPSAMPPHPTHLESNLMAMQGSMVPVPMLAYSGYPIHQDLFSAGLDSLGSAVDLATFDPPNPSQESGPTVTGPYGPWFPSTPAGSSGEGALAEGVGSAVHLPASFATAGVPYDSPREFYSGHNQGLRSPINLSRTPFLPGIPNSGGSTTLTNANTGDSVLSAETVQTSDVRSILKLLRKSPLWPPLSGMIKCASSFWSPKKFKSGDEELLKRYLEDLKPLFAEPEDECDLPHYPPFEGTRDDALGTPSSWIDMPETTSDSTLEEVGNHSYSSNDDVSIQDSFPGFLSDPESNSVSFQALLEAQDLMPPAQSDFTSTLAKDFGGALEAGSTG